MPLPGNSDAVLKEVINKLQGLLKEPSESEFSSLALKPRASTSQSHKITGVKSLMKAAEILGESRVSVTGSRSQLSPDSEKLVKIFSNQQVDKARELTSFMADYHERCNLRYLTSNGDYVRFDAGNRCFAMSLVWLEKANYIAWGSSSTDKDLFDIPETSKIQLEYQKSAPQGTNTDKVKAYLEARGFNPKIVDRSYHDMDTILKTSRGRVMIGIERDIGRVGTTEGHAMACYIPSFEPSKDRSSDPFYYFFDPNYGCLKVSNGWPNGNLIDTWVRKFYPQYIVWDNLKFKVVGSGVGFQKAVS